MTPPLLHERRLVGSRSVVQLKEHWLTNRTAYSDDLLVNQSRENQTHTFPGFPYARIEGALRYDGGTQLLNYPIKSPERQQVVMMVVSVP